MLSHRSDGGLAASLPGRNSPAQADSRSLREIPATRVALRGLFPARLGLSAKAHVRTACALRWAPRALVGALRGPSGAAVPDMLSHGSAQVLGQPRASNGRLAWADQGGKQAVVVCQGAPV